MERMGILEMNELHKAELIRQLENDSKPSFAFTTLLENDFSCIPEGFTGIYMRDDECQIVPNELLPKIKEMSLGGFDDAPEDHELHLFVGKRTVTGFFMSNQIVEMVHRWLDKEIER